MAELQRWRWRAVKRVAKKVVVSAERSLGAGAEWCLTGAEGCRGGVGRCAMQGVARVV